MVHNVTIDEILNETFTLSSLSPPLSTRPLSKGPSFRHRGQRPRPHCTLYSLQNLDGKQSLGSKQSSDSRMLQSRLLNRHCAVILDFESIVGEGGHIEDGGCKQIVIDLDGIAALAHPGSLKDVWIVLDAKWQGTPINQRLSEKAENLIFITHPQDNNYEEGSTSIMESILERLYAEGIKRLMIVGKEARELIFQQNLYDKIILTILPVFGGADGVRFENVNVDVLGGSDIVFSAEPAVSSEHKR